MTANPALPADLAQRLRELLSASGGTPVYLDDQVLHELEHWSLNTRRNSARYVREQQSYLREWAQHLRGVDLRQLVLGVHVVPHLPVAGRAPRIAALKVACSYLRNERHQLELDPCAGLTVPQYRPAQWRRSKAIPVEHLVKVLRLMRPRWRDLLTVLCGTGWHVSELKRFTADGLVERPRRQQRGVSAVLLTLHKHGAPHRTAVSRRVREAAERVRARGSWSEVGFRRATLRACRAAEVPPFTGGRLRHTVATWALNEGAELGAVATFLGHLDGRTTRRWYATHAVPPRVPTPL